MTLVTAKKRWSGIRKVPLKKNTPTATAAPMPTIVPIQVCNPSLESSTARRISASSAPSRNAVHQYDHRNHEHGSHKEQQPFESVFADSEAFQGYCASKAESRSRRHAVPGKARQLPASRPGEVD